MKAYFGAFFLPALALFAALWVFVARQYGAIGPLDYQFAQSHVDSIRHCDVGELAVLGDSTGNADFIPSRMGPNVRVLATGGFTPVEVYFTARSVLNCPQPPKGILLAFAAQRLSSQPTEPGSSAWFFTRGMEWKLVNLRDAMEVLRDSRQLGDDTVAGPRSLFDVEYRVKALLYAIRFPPYHFARFRTYLYDRLRRDPSLDSQAQRLAYEETSADAGHHFYGTQADGLTDGPEDLPLDDKPADSGPRYQISALTDFYMRQIIRLARERGTTVYLVEQPRNRKAFLQHAPGEAEGYRGYLQTLARTEPNVVMLDGGFRLWSTQLFGDLSHLNLRGALFYSEQIRQALLQSGVAAKALYDAEPQPVNLYQGIEPFESMPASADATGGTAMAPVAPRLRFAPSMSSAAFAAPAVTTLRAKPLPLQPQSYYATSVFLTATAADEATLRVDWPGGMSGAVTWDFIHHRIRYEGMANTFNSGVTLCADRSMQLFLGGPSGPGPGPRPGMQLAVHGAPGTAVEVYDLSVEQSLWPSNYCVPGPDDAPADLLDGQLKVARLAP